MDSSALSAGGLDHTRWLSSGTGLDKARVPGGGAAAKYGSNAQAATSDTAAAHDARTAGRGPADRGPAETARQFESMLLRQLMQTMRRTSLGQDTSNAMRTYYDMMDEQLASIMAERGSIGIAQAIEQQIRAQQNLATGDDRSAPATRAAQAGESALPAAPLGFVENLWGGRAYENYSSGGVLPSAQPLPYGSQQAEFVQSLWPHAHRAAERIGTRASAVVAVAALETGFGHRVMGDGRGGSSNNLFGIKHHGSQHGSVTHQTTEFMGGQPRTVQADFRRYDSVAQSVDDFASFLIDNPRYADALEHARDPQRFAEELQRAGYATDPEYANKLRQLIGRIESHMGASTGLTMNPSPSPSGHRGSSWPS